METKGERLKQLRKELCIKQGDFADKIETTQGHISDIENGRKPLSERSIKLICLTNWNGKYVNKEWLEKGTGDMFEKFFPEDEFSEAIGNMTLNEEDKIIRDLVIEYAKLDNTSKQVIRNLLQTVVDKQKK